MSSLEHNCQNNFPSVIGILCIDIAVDLREVYGNEYYSYIAASYVKYLESAGAHVIPIWINRPRSYYEAIMGKINGILMPGGAVFFDKKECSDSRRNDCVQSSKYIYEIAEELSKKGEEFPLWGTCMGFQLMLTHSAKQVEIRQDCKRMHCSLPVEFEKKEVLASSKLFAHLDNDVKTKMSSLPFGVHYHKYCITKEDLRLYKIDKEWKVLASNKDENGLEFITIIEHNSLPFFGAQIHPERVVFGDSEPNVKIHHCLECFELAQYFAKFFVQKCSLNKNRFPDKKEEIRHWIQNFPVVFNTHDKKAEKKLFQQFYIFKDDIDYPKEVKNEEEGTN